VIILVGTVCGVVGMIEAGGAVRGVVPYQHATLASRGLDGPVTMTHVAPPARNIQLLVDQQATAQRRRGPPMPARMAATVCRTLHRTIAQPSDRRTGSLRRWAGAVLAPVKT